jgi:hypothetical protein
VTYWVIITLNIAAPAVRGVSGAMNMNRFLQGKPVQQWLKLTLNISLETVGVLQVYSGVMLVSSVIKIKRFFAERNANNFINTSMLLRHAMAFGLYMATTVAFFLALCYWGWA